MLNAVQPFCQSVSFSDFVCIILYLYHFSWDVLYGDSSDNRMANWNIVKVNRRQTTVWYNDYFGLNWRTIDFEKERVEYTVKEKQQPLSLFSNQ